MYLYLISYYDLALFHVIGRDRGGRLLDGLLRPTGRLGRAGEHIAEVSAKISFNNVMIMPEHNNTIPVKQQDGIVQQCTIKCGPSFLLLGSIFLLLSRRPNKKCWCDVIRVLILTGRIVPCRGFYH